MASSLLHFSIPLTQHHSTTPDSACSITCFLPGKTRAQNFSHSTESGGRNSFANRRRGHVCNSSLDEVSKIYPSETEKSKAEFIGSLKLKLLSAVSGLNRGLAAKEDDLRKADEAAKELESVAGPVDVQAEIEKLQGRWKLIYSSAFSSRTLGGSRPGPPTGRFYPNTLGQVFQRIDILSKDFDNIVEVEFGGPWPVPIFEFTATLAHKFKIIGTSKIKITFEKTTVKPFGFFSRLPAFEVPGIPDTMRRPWPSNPATGEFDVTYLDWDTRITRGDRGELRVFVAS